MSAGTSKKICECLFRFLDSVRPFLLARAGVGAGIETRKTPRLQISRLILFIFTPAVCQRPPRRPQILIKSINHHCVKSSNCHSASNSCRFFNLCIILELPVQPITSVQHNVVHSIYVLSSVHCPMDRNNGIPNISKLDGCHGCQGRNTCSTWLFRALKLYGANGLLLYRSLQGAILCQGVSIFRGPCYPSIALLASVLHRVGWSVFQMKTSNSNSYMFAMGASQA
jgi:hypothetical protein